MVCRSKLKTIDRTFHYEVAVSQLDVIDIKTSTVSWVNLRFLGYYRVDSDQDPLLGDRDGELGIVYIRH